MEEFEARHGSPRGTIMLGGQRVSLEDAPEGTHVEEIEPQEETEQHQEQPLRRSSCTHTQVTPRPERQRHGSRPPPRPRGPPLVEHLDLRAAIARQVQQLRFVEVELWFPPQWDERASEGFYIVL